MLKSWPRILALIFGVPVFLCAIFFAYIYYLGVSKDINNYAKPVNEQVDASHLQPTHMDQVIMVASDSLQAVTQIISAIETAKKRKLKISIAGARHSMGGHTVFPDGILLDMLDYKHLTLDSANANEKKERVLHVGSGARWSDIIPYLDARGYAVKIMQSNNPFTVGGTMSVNAHGWQHNMPPFASSVKAFRLITVDGKIQNCSRIENPELFRLVLGGYGLFGVVLDVDLVVIPNRIYRAERFEFSSEFYPKKYHTLVDEDTTLGLVYGRLSVAPSSFLHQALLTRYISLPENVPTLAEEPKESLRMQKLKHRLFLASVGSGIGKEFRWMLEKWAGGESAAKATRNRILNDPIDLFENHDSTRTQLLHEYFIPRDSIESFLKEARMLIPKYHGDLLNLTVRSLEKDTDSYLAYAREKVFSFVMLFSQEVNQSAEENMQTMTRSLITAALDVGGTYYLPYRLHATPEQFLRSYPMANAFFDLKRKYDPEEIFQNKFYAEYGSLKTKNKP